MPKSFSNSSKTSSNASLVAACAVAFALGACGGSGGSNGGGTTPPPGGGTGSQEVCSGTAVEAPEDDRQEIPGAQPLRAPASGDLASRKAERVDGNPRGRLLDALWLNKSRAGRISRPTGLTAGPNAIDIGEIAIVQDEGDLIESPNAYDLHNLGLRFTRNPSGGYDVSRIDGAFRTSLGTRLTLTDDDSVQVNVGFGFTFYGQTQATAFVNSDGNITFGAGGPREHRPQRGSAADRSATDRPVPCRSRSEHGRWPCICERRRGPVHGDVVRRAGLRVDPHDQCAADASARWLDRNQVRNGDADRGRRRRVSRSHRRVLSGRPQRERSDWWGRWRRGGAVRRDSPSSTPSRWRASSISRIPTTTTSW